MCCDEDKHETTRRDFINELAGGLATLGLAGNLIANYAFGAGDKPRNSVAALKIDEHPEFRQVGGYVVLKKTALGDVLVIRSSDAEYSAMSLVCPHLQCNIKVKSATLIQCPCHQSGYKTDGTYISGPAKTGLRRFPLTIEDGTIMVWPDA